MAILPVTRGHDRRFRCGKTGLIHVGPDGVCTVCGRLIREPRPPVLGWPHPIPEEEKDWDPLSEVGLPVMCILGVLTVGVCCAAIILWAVGGMK